MPNRNFPIVGVHLDLKYLMPNKKYLLRWLREIAAMGHNALLLEYEDAFPFSKYPFLRSPGAFTPEELRKFLDTARGLGLQVIPLVQTFSHLEFALAHDELADLRELPNVPTQINPKNPSALRFVHELIDEVLAYHQEDAYFHVGGDEAWHVGHNPRYADEVKELGLVGFWARHERQFLERIIAAGKRPIIWDDPLWPDPQVIKTLDLPKQTVLASWNYGIRTLFKDGKESLNCVNVYREAGYDVLAVPCFNWGVLTPMHDHNLENTTAWAQKARRADMMGMLNSAWACFHVPLPVQMLHAAATAELMTGARETLDRQWEAEFAERWFGLSAEGANLAAELLDALRDISVTWSFKVPGYSRPITPVIYGYMDMVLHFPGEIEERRARGAYPLDWVEIDFVAMFEKKLELLAQAEDPAAVDAKLDELQTTYDRGLPILQRLAQQATEHREEARLLALSAHMKALHVRVLRHLLRGQGERAALRDQWKAVKPELLAALRPFMDKSALSRVLRMWWEPSAKTLASKLPARRGQRAAAAKA